MINEYKKIQQQHQYKKRDKEVIRIKKGDEQVNIQQQHIKDKLNKIQK